MSQPHRKANPPVNRIHDPKELRKLNRVELAVLAEYLRDILIDVSYKNGGHLASNLGVVELIMAIHRTFESPVDKILFDVSHQAYVHKLLTGRNNDRFMRLRQTGGYSGFCNPAESTHDVFHVGHAGTSLSTALGMCIARDRLGQRHRVVVVLGDGALSCGLTMEALNNLTGSTERLIVVLNDNDYSIDRNIGALAKYLNRIILSRAYKVTMRWIGRIFGAKKIGLKLWRIGRKFKLTVKDLLLSSSFFEHYGLRYVGPVDGHNLIQLEEYLKLCRDADYPILLHVKTVKGKGSVQAVANPVSCHRVGPAQTTGESPSMKDIFAKTVTELAEDDGRVFGVTAAMASGTGLSQLRESRPDQYIDVGIAEEHAVAMCAGLARGGMRPICAIYSTFMQRAFDQIFHDICLQNLPVIFCLDRAGLSPNDGPTHHGLFDISYIRCLPNAVLMQPKNPAELAAMLRMAMGINAPIFLRYNSAYSCYADGEVGVEIAPGRSETIKEGSEVCLLALGHFVSVAMEVDAMLGGDCGIVNVRSIKPLDGDMLLSVAKRYATIVTMEDGVLAGGFGSAALEFFCENGAAVRVIRIGWPDKFIEHGSSEEELRRAYKLDAQSIVERIRGDVVEVAGVEPASR